jgi:hypothetical protein
MGSNGWLPNEQVAVLEMVATGKLEPVIHATRPLSEIATSMRELIDRLERAADRKQFHGEAIASLIDTAGTFGS